MDFGGPKEAQVPTIYPHWRHLAKTTEPSVCGGKAALSQITLITYYCCCCYHDYVIIIIINIIIMHSWLSIDLEVEYMLAITPSLTIWIQASESCFVDAPERKVYHLASEYSAHVSKIRHCVSCDVGLLYQFLTFHFFSQF